MCLMASPSLRGRGLKSRKIAGIFMTKTVALFARAWIEIVNILTSTVRIKVALFARAWIEIVGF